MKRRRIIKLTALLAITSLAVIMFTSCHKGSKSYTFETATVKKGSIINTVTATGTVEADTTVLIGTQVSGVVKKVYVDFNSHVKRGQLLAELDQVPLQSQVQQAEASLESAKSEVAFQTASYERYKALLDKKLVAQADYDQVKYSYDNAKANLKTAQAGYDKALVNLSYASIFSPIYGVVLNRAVDQGQTVAASFSTPNLFTIGNDLTHMQVQAAVDEADIGQLKQGQPVSFTVDAYPTESFKGDVRQIRLQPTVTSNVVTYTVIVNAPNPDLKLMPGMTANITVLVQKLDSVLIVPGKSLRFTPDATWLADYMKNNPLPQRPGGTGTNGTRGTGEGGQGGQFTDAQRQQFMAAQGGQGGQSSNPFTAGGAGQNRKPTIVWVKNGDKFRRARIATGAIDGTNAEVKFGLKEGDEVVLSMSLAGKILQGTATTTSTQNTTNPFMPARPGGRGR